jgi:hypothetical protein
MAEDDKPDANANVPPASPGHTEGHNDGHNPPPVTETPPPAQTSGDGHSSDNDRIGRLENAMTGLTETLTTVVDKLNGLVDSNPISDDRPVSVPWTHKGKW